ncbi:roadblock/LC7 domain-containing protein [Streptomyces sp. NPDC015131]|uniref:roadblock/LC7 domain-containing protein n=1 Tax=Streptomyces sp. NPDC015131 TaxID=3364941 RepID=UPI0036FEA659
MTAAEAEVLGELRRLRARVPQVTGALAASTDGMVLARDTADADAAEGVAALTAAALGVALRLTDATGQGGFRELLVRGEHGYVATYAAGGSAVLTLLAEPRINVGRLHLEARRASVRIGELVDGALDRREAPAASAPGPVPAPAPAPISVRTPAVAPERAARATPAATARTPTATAPSASATPPAAGTHPALPVRQTTIPPLPSHKPKEA